MKIKVSGVPYEVDIDTLEQENRQMRARMNRLEEENKLLQKREWVGLTDDELKALCDEWQIIYGGYVRPFAETIEAKLKEKNT